MQPPATPARRAVVCRDPLQAAAALAAGIDVVLISLEPAPPALRSAATAAPRAGRLAVMVGDPGDPAAEAAAVEMAAEVFARKNANQPSGRASSPDTEIVPGRAPMQISMQLDYSGSFKQVAQRVVDLEKAGLDLVWAAEAYSFDGVSIMGYLAALTERIQIASGILPIYTRTPTLLAMTAAGLDALSDGRFHLGLGASGPQVIEGFHGVPYDAPIGRTREVIEICRKVWKREAPLQYDGRYYHLPLPAGQGTGLGKPLKIIGRPNPDIPVWIAAIGEKNVELAAEVAEGWLPIFFMPEKARDVWGGSIEAGQARRDPARGTLQIAAGGLLAIGEGDDVTRLRDLARPQLALYIGGMGAKGKNFYNTLAQRYGYEKEAAEIQDLYLDGKKDEAAAAIPAELVTGLSLVGPRSFVAERIAAMRDAGVTHLNVTPIPVGDKSALDQVAEVKELAG